MEKKFELVYNKEYKTIFVRCGNQTFVPEQLLQKPPALPEDVEEKMREILKYVRQAGNPHDEVVAESLYNLTEKQIMEYGLAQLLSLYPQMASEIEIADKIAQYVFGVKGLCGAGFEDAEITAIQECAHALVGKVAKPQENKRKTPVHLIDGTCEKCGKSLCYCIERLDNGNWVGARPQVSEDEPRISYECLGCTIHCKALIPEVCNFTPDRCLDKDISKTYKPNWKALLSAQGKKE